MIIEKEDVSFLVSLHKPGRYISQIIIFPIIVDNQIKGVHEE